MTTIVGLPGPSNLRVEVFNILGRRVAVLANGSFKPGYHKFIFDAGRLSSGLYFIHASTPSRFNEIRKVILLR